MAQQSEVKLPHPEQSGKNEGEKEIAFKTSSTTAVDCCRDREDRDYERV